ncbi:hypothetical protein [Paenibacillus graminis]|uniref:Uncharacterized protein n=1 Tax=Paenibacillus graminis TaxID=189425 RepID=A0A089MGK2_9BACL|nr:hypothetical protein [Paenibacillus graminis]AIQ70638.1 hypothetical protein PGRAT_25665 [Paenibacillus graminis]
MPLGLILALVRFMGSHFKNYRKPVNISLLYHVFMGGFVQMMVFVMYTVTLEPIDTVTFIFMLVLVAVFLLLPASGFAASAAKARFKFSQLANAYVQLINDGGIRYLGNLSEQTGQSESDVRRDLLYLQSHGALSAGLVMIEGRAATVP